MSMTDKCAKCGFPRKEHSYNGACYGLCGAFVEPPMTDGQAGSWGKRSMEEQVATLTRQLAEARADRDIMRVQLTWIVNYFQGGIRPADCRDWWLKSCEVLAHPAALGTTDAD